MRLIDADTLMEALNDYVRQAFDCDGIDEGSVIEYQELHKDVTSYIIQGLCEAYGVLQEQPTAYNVDAVVEELAKMEKKPTEWGIPYIDYEKAIEIVKAGGVE